MIFVVCFVRFQLTNTQELFATVGAMDNTIHDPKKIPFK
jgi:hypothetical protein